MSLTANNKLDTNKYELTIHIDAESFEKALEKAYRKDIKKIKRKEVMYYGRCNGVSNTKVAKFNIWK